MYPDDRRSWIKGTVTVFEYPSVVEESAVLMLNDLDIQYTTHKCMS